MLIQTVHVAEISGSGKILPQKFKFVPRVQQRYRRQTDRRQNDDRLNPDDSGHDNEMVYHMKDSLP